MPSEPLEVTTTIDVPAAAVWAIVSDVGRMGEWSPECRKVVVWGRGGRARQGTWLTGINRSGWFVWPTNSQVHEYVEGVAIGWTVLESGAQWTYRLEAVTDTTTLLVERRDLPDGKTWIARIFARTALGGDESHDRLLRRGMQKTLARIKAEAEAEAAGSPSDPSR